MFYILAEFGCYIKSKNVSTETKKGDLVYIHWSNIRLSKLNEDVRIYGYKLTAQKPDSEPEPDLNKKKFAAKENSHKALLSAGQLFKITLEVKYEIIDLEEVKYHSFSCEINTCMLKLLNIL